MIITSAPCMPKETYHCGNAISSIYVQVLANYINFITNNSDIKLIDTPWNLHGLPYEKLFYEKKEYYGSYKEILEYAEENKSLAMKETNLFLTGKYHENHSDVDYEFCEYTKYAFIKLISDGFLLKKGETWYFDTAKLLDENIVDYVFNGIDVYPKNLKKAIVKQKITFDSFYPFSKNRIFTVEVNYKGDIIKINPIFQSFIYTSFLAQKYKQDKVDFFVCGSGFSMLKWHYYRQLVSFALNKNNSIKNIVFHGTILGQDGKPMSKHSTNCITPSYIYSLNNDKIFLRYVLIRSISVNDICIYIDKYSSEYKRIENKINSIMHGKKICPSNNNYIELLDDVFKYMSNYKFSVALETFYTYLSKVHFSYEGNISILKKLKDICNIFFS